MNVQKETSQYLWICCPLHRDETASRCINKVKCNGYPAGYWYCYSCGKHGEYDLKEVKMASKKKSICRQKRAVNWDALTERYKEELGNTYSWIPLARTWNIKPLVLNQYDVGCHLNYYTFPMRNEDTYICGIQKRYFRSSDKSCVEGSHLGLFIPHNCLHKQVVVTEGASDAAVATECGYCGVGKPSASFGELLVRKYLEKIGYQEEIIIVQDNDQAGVTSRIKLQAALKNWRIKVVVPTHDLRDYYLTNGKQNTINLLGD